MLAGLRVHSQNGVVRDAEGRLAGSALTMDLAARNFARFVPGVSAWTLARVAAMNPARLIGAHDLGVIAIGTRAMFAVRAPDGAITALDLSR